MFVGEGAEGIGWPFLPVREAGSEVRQEQEQRYHATNPGLHAKAPKGFYPFGATNMRRIVI